MSDSINALLGAQRSGSVLDAIAHPAQLNVLGAYQGAAQTADAIFGVQQKQGQQLWGQALQQATDPTTGVVDFNKAQRIAATMGPAAAMVAGTNLANTSNIKGQQLQQAGSLYSTIGQLSASLMNDTSDANVAAIRAQAVAAGLPPSALAEIDRIAKLPEAQRKTEAYQHNLAAMDGQYRLAVGGFPAYSGVATGGQVVPLGTVPASPYGQGGIVQGGGAANVTPSPGEFMGGGGITYPATQADVNAGNAKTVGQSIFIPQAEVYRRAGIPVPPGLQGGAAGAGASGGGVVDSSGKPVSPTNQPRLLVVPGQASAPPAAAPGAPGASTAAPGRPLPLPPPPAPGASTAAPVPVPAPPVAPPAAAAPVVAPAVPTAPAAVLPAGFVPGQSPRQSMGPSAAPQGGVQVASANALAPNLGSPAPASPLVPGDVNAIVAGMNRGAATPSTGTQTAFNTIAVGPGTEEAQGYKTSADKLAADSMAAANFQNTQFPYVQALKNYGEGTTTGPTTDFWNQVAGTIRTPLAKLGLNIGTLDDNTQRQDALGKWLANIQSGNPMSGKSDAELAQVLKGSASAHINETTGADMVKAGLALQRMNVAATREWQSNPALQQQYGTYLNYLGNYNSTTDPRAFAVDTYNPQQIARLRTQLQSGSDADAQRFENSLALARRNGMISGAGSQAMP